METTHYIAYVESPLGFIQLVSNGKALTRLYTPEHRLYQAPLTQQPAEEQRCPVLALAKTQLLAYFAGQRTEFDVPLAMQGTAFQTKVWQALQTIGYGQTCSYQQLAQMVGSPKASRAVGLANGKNPVSIIVPCHRVVGANGQLTGYAGGLSAKSLLLSMEKAIDRVSSDRVVVTA